MSDWDDLGDGYRAWQRTPRWRRRLDTFLFWLIVVAFVAGNMLAGR